MVESRTRNQVNPGSNHLCYRFKVEMSNNVTDDKQAFLVPNFKFLNKIISRSTGRNTKSRKFALFSEYQPLMIHHKVLSTSTLLRLIINR